MKIHPILITFLFLFPLSSLKGTSFQEKLFPENEKELANLYHWEKERTGFPESWTRKDEGVLDVAIIGAGMAGSAVCFALQNLGIDNLLLFDENAPGEEGPWRTTARMLTLRSEKEAAGPSFGRASLSFQAWYEARFGKEAWEKIELATPLEFADYLQWYQKLLHLPIKSHHRLKKITPLSDSLFSLEFEVNGTSSAYLTKKIVLATGRAGLGGPKLPPYAGKLNKDLYAHTSEKINFSSFKDKSIAVIGAGASSFDAAGALISEGAKKVEMLFRKKDLSKELRFSRFAHVGVEQGFHRLSDAWKVRLVAYGLSESAAPTKQSIDRLLGAQSFLKVPGIEILDAHSEEDGVKLFTNQGARSYDFVIFATGYLIDLTKVPFLTLFSSMIKTYEEQQELHSIEGFSLVKKFPYLGDHYQFQEKTKGEAPFLRHIYCFNYGALVSHGMTSSSIDPLSIGADRLAKGIAADFFLEDIDFFYEEFISTEERQ